MSQPTGEPTTTDTVVTEPPEAAPDTGTDWKAEAEKWKALARKHEGTAKANYSALQEIKQKQSAQQEPDQADNFGEVDGESTEQVQAALARAWKAEVKAEVAMLAPGMGIDPAVIWKSNRIAGALAESLDDRDDIAEMDPASDDFREELKKALAEIAEDFPRVKVATGPRPDPSQGARGAGPSLDSRIAEAQKAGDWRTVISLQNQKLANT